MKKILLIILLLFLCKFACGQDSYNNYYSAITLKDFGYKLNTLYALIQPTDLGVGLRYDRVILNHFGAYTSASYGNYKLPDGSYLNDHFKVALGGVLISPSFFESAFLTGGISYHHYGDYFFAYGEPDWRVLCPVSVEFGAGARVGWATVAFRMDVLKWESSIDFGFNF